VKRRPSGQEVVEGLKLVCLCKGIRTASVLKKIRAGTRTVAGIRKATGAGSGSCKGGRCTPRIEALLRKVEKEEHTSGGR
jgi:NAD(P)H-nitrite reductase large subunit